MNKRIDTPFSEGISPLGTFLSDLHDNIGRAEITGKVADYIPELAKADPNWFGISIVTNDGYEYGRGDTEVLFTIQSISKAFTYGLALQEWGRRTGHPSCGGGAVWRCLQLDQPGSRHGAPVQPHDQRGRNRCLGPHF